MKEWISNCQATPEDHCCWVDGQVCEWFDPDNVKNQRGCKLRDELGDWESVYKDRRYPSKLTAKGIRCGDWPGKDVTCKACWVKF